MSTTFEIGTIYTTGENRDYIWRFRVVSRTAKFITIQQVGVTGTDLHRTPAHRVGVHMWAGREAAMPLGQFANAPWISADAPYVPAVVDTTPRV